MRVQLDNIGPEGFDLDEPVTREWLDKALGEHSPFRAHGDGRLTVHLERVENIVYVRGTARLILSAECSRCLEPVRLPVSAAIEVSLFPKGKEPEAETGGEISEDDMGVSTYEEQAVDLGNIVHDEVFLELPLTPLCKESCAGLCSQCGHNLNQGACGCQPVIDPRWTALLDLKKPN